LAQTVQVIPFNETLCSTIDDTIAELLGRGVLESVYVILRVKYGVNRDELPYRLDSLYEILGNAFPILTVGTLGTHIALRFYTRLGMTFHEHEGYTLLDYVQTAKSELASLNMSHQEVRNSTVT